MRRFQVMALICLAFIIGAFLAQRSLVSEVSAPPATDRPPQDDHALSSTTQKRHDEASVRVRSHPTVRRRSSTEQTVRHRSLLEALAHRAVDVGSTAQTTSRSSPSAEPSAPGGREDEDEDEDVSDEEMTEWNRELMARASEELTPLVDECFTEASAHVPNIERRAHLELTVIADEEHGGLIESVEFSQSTASPTPGLTECIRETLLSTALPPPPFDGPKQIVMIFGGEQ